jgi:nitrite reductase/ring-hydroxylating ferredoxin subunit
MTIQSFFSQKAEGDEASSSKQQERNKRKRRDDRGSSKAARENLVPKSVVQSFFSKDPEPVPEEPEEEAGLFRGMFRRGSKSDEEEEMKNKKNKDENKLTRQGQPKPNRRQVQAAKESTKVKPSTKQKAATKPVRGSDKLRQQVVTNKDRTRGKGLDAKNVKEKESATDENDPSVLNRFTGWLGNRGNTTENAENTGGRGNSTNPLSALQTAWQDSPWRRSSTEEWVDVLPKTRLAPGEVVPVTVGGLDLLVIASSTSGNRLYAIANSCPHLGTPLEIGQLVRLPKEAPGTDAGSSSDAPSPWTELEVSSILQQDGCEDCIVCPLHRTAFALDSGQVRGEWCPYPPVVGKLTGLIKESTPVATFDVRVRGKNVQVRMNSPLPETDGK